MKFQLTAGQMYMRDFPLKENRDSLKFPRVHPACTRMLHLGFLKSNLDTLFQIKQLSVSVSLGDFIKALALWQLKEKLLSYHKAPLIAQGSYL